MSAPPYSSRDRDAQHAQFAELAPQVGGKAVAAVDLRRARRHLAPGEAAHGIAQGVDVRTQVEIQSLHHAGQPPAPCSSAIVRRPS